MTIIVVVSSVVILTIETIFTLFLHSPDIMSTYFGYVFINIEKVSAEVFTTNAIYRKNNKIDGLIQQHCVHTMHINLT